MVHLLSQLEVQRLELVQKEEELTAGRQELRREQEALQVARAQLEILEAQISESQEQLGRELEKSKDLEEERERLEEKVYLFREQSGAREVSGLIQADALTVAISHGFGGCGSVTLVAQTHETVLCFKKGRRIAWRFHRPHQRLDLPAEGWKHSVTGRLSCCLRPVEHSRQDPE